MAKDESLGSIVGGLLGAFANEVDIFSGPGKSGPNNTAGNASHSQSSGLFGGESSGSSEQKGGTTVHHDSKGGETGRTEQHGDSLTHFDAGSSFFGGLDSQQTGRSVVSGNHANHFDNGGNLVGWSITHNNGRVDSYDRNGNHTHTSHTSASRTSETIPARIGNSLSSVARQISNSAPWSTRGSVEGGRSESARNYTATPPINIDWVIVGRCALAVLILSLFVGLCTAVVRSMNGQAAATKSKVSRSSTVDKSGRVVAGTRQNSNTKPMNREDFRRYLQETSGPSSEQPKRTPRPLFVLHRSDGTTEILSDQDVATGVLEERYHVDDNGNVTEQQSAKMRRSSKKPAVDYVGGKTTPTIEEVLRKKYAGKTGYIFWAKVPVVKPWWILTGKGWVRSKRDLTVRPLDESYWFFNASDLERKGWTAFSLDDNHEQSYALGAGLNILEVE